MCQNPECGKPYQPIRENQVACSRTCLLKCPSYIESQRRTDMRPERQSAKNRQRQLDSAADRDARKFLNFRGNMRRLYQIDITRAQYQAWAAGRVKACALCGALPPDHRDLHVDHDHQTGQLRDYLCWNCNRGLGSFKDDPALLRAAADYIERHRAMAEETRRKAGDPCQDRHS